MGGRGSNSSTGKTVSQMMAKVTYNAAKKSIESEGPINYNKDADIERAIKTGNVNSYVSKVVTRKEAETVMNYLYAKQNDLARQIVNSGGPDELRKKPSLYYSWKNTVSMINALREQSLHGSASSAQNAREAQHSFTTSTYDRARNNRIKNFESWFYGGKRK